MLKVGWQATRVGLKGSKLLAYCSLGIHLLEGWEMEVSQVQTRLYEVNSFSYPNESRQTSVPHGQTFTGPYKWKKKTEK